MLRESISIPRLCVGTIFAQSQFAKAIHKFRSQAVMAKQESHVNGTVQRIEKQIHIDIFLQLAAGNAPAQCGVSLLAPWFHETFAKSGDQVVITLPGAQHGGDDTSAAAAENFYKLPHLLVHVAANRTGIGKMQLASGTAGECVGDESTLIRPPTINCRFAHV